MRFRLYPTPAQTVVLERHCADARFIWNLALEQWNMWRPGRKGTPDYLEQSRQLTELRAAFPWVEEGSRIVQQQALRDFDQAKQFFYAGTHRKPSWRRKGSTIGFRVVGRPARAWEVRRLNRHWGEVRIPKAGWVRFRMSRSVPGDVKSYRVTFKANQWHIAFACIPRPIPGPCDGSLLGIDRGIAVSFVCSDGTSYSLPNGDAVKLRRLQRHLARQKKGSGHRDRTKVRIIKVRGKDTRCRKDVVEKVTTDLARRCDYFRIEDLRISSMTKSAKGTVDNPGRSVKAKSRLNQAIFQSGWGLFARRLEDKAPYRVERVKPHFTSQTCPSCQHVSPENRKSQAIFRCVACGFSGNADWVASVNIAAGHAATAREGLGAARPPTNREPQPPGWNPGESPEDVKATERLESLPGGMA